jgi:pseudouridine-5'-phosphate glycosidase
MPETSPGQGMLVAVPNPSPSADIEAAIQEALKRAAADSILGAKITPYVLAMVKELTGEAVGSCSTCSSSGSSSAVSAACWHDAP